MTCDRGQLIESGLHLAWWIAGRWSRNRPDMADDMRQEACVALLCAAAKFDPNHPRANWPGYLRSRVEFALLNYLQKIKQARERFPAKSPMVHDGEAVQAVDLIPVAPARRQGPAFAATVARARAAVQALPPRQRQVVTLRYLSPGGQTLATVGEQLGVTRERVRQIEYQALARLRWRL